MSSSDKAPYSKIEPPFDIPESWCWVRLNSLSEIIGGGTLKTTDNENWDNGIIDWLTPTDMKFISGKYVDKSERKITEKGLKSSSARILSKNSIVYSSRAPIGYIAITKKSYVQAKDLNLSIST